MTFEKTLETHLKAIKEHNIELFKTTLHPGYDVVCIEPDGQFIKDYHTFLENQISWFADESWHINFEILDLLETTEISIATTRLELTETNGKYFTILTLTFSKIGEKWGLIYDQNTPIHNV